MIRRLALCGVLGLVITASTTLPVSLAGATVLSLRASVSATVPPTFQTGLPLVRLHFTAPVNAKQLPPLETRPALRTTWEQIGPNDVQAVTAQTLAPLATYVVVIPRALTCSARCHFAALQARSVTVSSNLSWEDQLLAELNYLPVSFTATSTMPSLSQPVAGIYSWIYPSLPLSLRQQWSLSTDNVILRGALMTFQSQHALAVTGEADPPTWTALVAAANSGALDPAPYNYVNVSMTLPETLTLFVAGRTVFHTLVNTGIPLSPTAPGTYPVYLRYTTTTMSGTNPNGSHYHDTGIPWVSYFNGGDALHGFIRSSYGFPQSLGCVEMPFADAKTVFPHTPIGTLVTVRA